MQASARNNDLKFKNFYNSCEDLANLIGKKKNALHRLLQSYETYDVVEDEIERSQLALRGLRDELMNINNPKMNLNIATFFPLNLPLYSLVLFGIAPSIFSRNLFIRPPDVMYETLEKLWKLLNIDTFFPVISLNPSPRHIFVQLYAQESDVIIFTGKYDNAIDIHQKCPYSVLLYNGSGINPFILFDNADVKLSVKKAIEMRCFNSGQDCAGPDAFFIPSVLADEFCDLLRTNLKKVKVGDSTDNSVTIGPTRKTSYIDELRIWLSAHDNDIIYGGKIDPKKNLVYPAIIRRKLSSTDKEDFHEFFAPYFYILEYDNNDTLSNILLSQPFKYRSMYVSIFGSNQELESKIKFAHILNNVIVNDIEYGNHEYGGYGKHSNFILNGESTTVKPILISRDMQIGLSE
jgi:acyl-CoA reductase-like NAD-dependent aldehyde dehydrogenase